MATRQAVTFPPTGAGLAAFIDHAMQRGLVEPQLGASYKTTCMEVLPMTLGQDWKSTDILAIDLPVLIDKFQQIKGRRMPVAGLELYSQRLIEAIELFRPCAQVTDTAGLAAVEPNPPGTAGRDGAAEPGYLLNGASGTSYQEFQPTPDSTPISNGSSLPVAMPTTTVDDVERLTYPFPLREGVVVTVCLPVDLTMAECVRLGRFIDSLAIEEPPMPAAPVKRRRAAAPRTATASSSRPRPAPATSRARSPQPAPARRSRSAGPS